MTKCTVAWTDDEHMKISGTIDETAEFEGEAAKFKNRVWVDFSGVNRINSCGVRQWTRAIRNSATQIIYVKAPSIIVDQFSMVPEFLGKNGTVESFAAHYACDKCGHEEDAFLVVGKDIQKGQGEYSEGPSHKCVKCSSQMEFDHSPEVYLHFLTKMGKNAA